MLNRRSFLQQASLAAGHHGDCGIEYEGAKPGGPEGIRATTRLLETARDDLG